MILGATFKIKLELVRVKLVGNFCKFFICGWKSETWKASRRRRTRRRIVPSTIFVWKKERFWVINRKTGRNKTIKFKTLLNMYKIEFWLMKSYVKYISCFVLEIASLNKIVKLLFLPLSFCNFSLSLLIFDICGLGQLFHFISYSWFL